MGYIVAFTRSLSTMKYLLILFINLISFLGLLMRVFYGVKFYGFCPHFYFSIPFVLNLVFEQK